MRCRSDPLPTAEGTRIRIAGKLHTLDRARAIHTALGEAIDKALPAHRKRVRAAQAKKRKAELRAAAEGWGWTHIKTRVTCPVFGQIVCVMGRKDGLPRYTENTLHSLPAACAGDVGDGPSLEYRIGSYPWRDFATDRPGPSTYVDAWRVKVSP